MGQMDYWVTIESTRGTCGAGFLLTRRYAFTAAHCLRNKANEDDQVTVSRGSDCANGRVVEVNDRRDVALIQIIGKLDWTVLPVSTDRCVSGDRWLSPYRPASSQSELKGFVLTSPIEFRCRGGDLVEALELEVRQLIGGYHGYSGSPVERDGEPEDRVSDDDIVSGRSVVGMLIEQDLHRVHESEATNVLFALTVQHAIDTFDLFKVPAQCSRLRPAPSGSLQESPTAPPGNLKTSRMTSPQLFLGARRAIAEIRALVADGYLPVSDGADIIRDAVREARGRLSAGMTMTNPLGEAAAFLEAAIEGQRIDSPEVTSGWNRGSAVSAVHAQAEPDLACYVAGLLSFVGASQEADSLLHWVIADLPPENDVRLRVENTRALFRPVEVILRGL